MENLIKRLTDHPLSATMDDIEILIKYIRELEKEVMDLETQSLLKDNK